MSRRPGFIVTILFFIIALVGFYFYLKRQQSPLTQPIHGVPVDAAMIIEIKQPTRFLDAFNHDSQLLNSAKKIRFLQPFFANVGFTDSLIKNTSFKSLIDDKSVFLSFHPNGNNEIDGLWISKLSGKFEANQWFRFIEEKLVGKDNITSSRYEQVRIYKAQSHNLVIYYAFNRGVFLASASEMLIKNAIRQLATAVGLHNNSDLESLLKTAGNNALANVYVKSPEFGAMLGKVISADNLKQNNIKKFGSWTLLDINLKKNTLLLNGFSKGVNPADFQYVLKGQEPINFKFTKFAPVGVQSFLAFGISNYDLYKNKLQEYMQANNQLDRFLVNQKSFRDAFGENSENSLAKIFNGELVQIRLLNNEHLFYIKTNGYRDAKDLINEWLTYYAQVTNSNINAFKNSYKLDNETQFPIFEMPLDFVPARLFGPWFKGGSAKYVTCFDDYLIFSSDYKSLTRTIYNNIVQKTLSFDSRYNLYSDFLASKINCHAFLSLQNNKGIWAELFSTKFYHQCTENESEINNFYGLSWQFANEGDLVYNNLVLKHQLLKKMSAATEWETRLDTLMAFKPQFVINHNNNSREIFIQDLKQNIYLINNAGRILWKKKLDNQILGEVYQVDYYKNGKLQYLFNTKNKLYLFDRNGNSVEHYPITLNFETELPLALFDYDKRKNYRLFVCGKNKKIALYDIKGNHVNGFKFTQTDNRIIAPVQYVRNNNKDYIIVTDSSRTYILNRRGEPRVKMKTQFEPSPNNTYVYQKGNSTRKGRLVRTNRNGTVFFVYFDGTVEQKSIEKFSAQHFFNVIDVTSDNIYDFIYVDKNKLWVYNISGNKEFSFKFDATINKSPAFYKFSAKQNYIGITDVENQKIYLIDNKGDIVQGFPLRGKTKFSIGYLNRSAKNFSLIVGGDDQYLYNYTLN